MAAAPAPESDPAARGELHLLFSLGGDRYALPARAVREVLPLQRLKQLPEAPPWVAGVLAHRGALLPVLDLGMRVLGRPARARTSTRLVLVEHPCGRALGLILEQAGETLRLPPAGPQDAALVQQPAYLGPVQAAGAALRQRIDVAGLLPADVADRLFPAADAPATEPTP
ncbi:MAG TPA: chemotaxis protein CheW [Roseateles sp.]|nr:chemotaxis protein CheW [Roseateles sp.]